MYVQEWTNLNRIFDSRESNRMANSLFFNRFLKNLSTKTIHMQSKKIKKCLNYMNMKKTTEYEYRIIEKVIKNNILESCKEIWIILRDDYQISISRNTLIARAKEL